MSEDWSKLLDVDPLADGGACLDFAIPLAEFPRLRPQLARADGAVTGRVGFDRERGLPIARVRAEGVLALTCQRCLAPCELPVRSEGCAALVADAVEADRAPAELETILAPGHRISLRDLVEEEMLLALPLVPRHAHDDCAEAAQAPEQTGAREPIAQGVIRATGRAPLGAQAPEEERHRPFERLSELLKRT